MNEVGINNVMVELFKSLLLVEDMANTNAK